MYFGRATVFLWACQHSSATPLVPVCDKPAACIQIVMWDCFDYFAGLWHWWEELAVSGWAATKQGSQQGSWPLSVGMTLSSYPDGAGDAWAISLSRYIGSVRWGLVLTKVHVQIIILVHITVYIHCTDMLALIATATDMHTLLPPWSLCLCATLRICLKNLLSLAFGTCWTACFTSASCRAFS